MANHRMRRDPSEDALGDSQIWANRPRLSKNAVMGHDRCHEYWPWDNGRELARLVRIRPFRASGFRLHRSALCCLAAAIRIPLGYRQDEGKTLTAWKDFFSGARR